MAFLVTGVADGVPVSFVISNPPRNKDEIEELRRNLLLELQMSGSNAEELLVEEIAPIGSYPRPIVSGSEVFHKYRLFVVVLSKVVKDGQEVANRERLAAILPTNGRIETTAQLRAIEEVVRQLLLDNGHPADHVSVLNVYPLME